jgi:hypothetical protein
VQENGKSGIPAGSQYIHFGIADRGGADKRLDRISLGVSAPEELKPQPVTDSDQITTEFSHAGWRLSGEMRAVLLAAQILPSSIFHPVAIWNVVLNVTDVTASTQFYQRFLGKPIPGDRGRVWFEVGETALGLQRRQEADTTAIHQLGVLVQSFDTGTAVRRLQRMGAKDMSLSTDIWMPRQPQIRVKTLLFGDFDGLAAGFRFAVTSV